MNTKSEYKICTRCVMDTTDPEIFFDNKGICNHCHNFDNVVSKGWYPNEEGEKKLQQMIGKIKTEGRGKEYDCILGLSGGVDSCYLALKLKKYGLRPLVVHVDGGWNSELAVSNIEKVVKYCNFDLHTHVINWEEMRDLQLAYLKAAVANQDVPQDHAYFANLYHFAIKNKIKTIISGGNIATEGVFPKSWHGSAMDATNLKDIHSTFGTRKLKQYKTISFFQYYIQYPFLNKMRTVRPLNYMSYNKQEAVEYLKDTIGWNVYARKHGESIFTKFFQNYYLPKKFNFDKRLPHLSSLIVSGQMSRDTAITSLSEPLYSEEELEQDTAYFCKKLRISTAEFDDIMTKPIQHHTQFSNWNKKYHKFKKLQRRIERITGKRISVYS